MNKRAADFALPPAARHSRRGPISPLVLRILAVNLIALAILAGGVLYLNQFRENLIERRLEQLLVQADIIAGAIGEAATGEGEATEIQPGEARLIIARLVGPTETRGRLFDTQGKLIVDSRFLATEQRVIAEPLPPLDAPLPVQEWMLGALNGLLDLFGARIEAPRYREGPSQQASDYIEVVAALTGEPATQIRRLGEDRLLLSAAVPVQRFRRVLGALMLSGDTADIEDIVRIEQITIIKVFGVSLAVTALLSIFLASTIARPVRRLAQAAEGVRRGMGRESEIPLLQRNDEIGDLSQALSDMTSALYRQIDAVGAFAADVAHELKNPLTSLRSAVESLERTEKPEVKERLLAIIQEDVRRLDRLISDISDASRLDAELSRTAMEPVDMALLVGTLVEAHRRADTETAPRILFHQPETGTVLVRGLESRLGQVVSNLLDNAISFSPPGGRIDVSLIRKGGTVQLTVEDEGPGLPEGAAEKIFNRFYSERPDTEAFGTHSGLGLSISKQIVEAHDGTILAENRTEPAGEEGEERVLGARFTVRLPALA